jgi:predicted Zn-dependent protease
MSALGQSGHVQRTSSCLLWANSGHRTTVNRKTASVAVLAKSDQVYRLVTAVAFFHCEANRAAHAILKNLGGDFVAWLSSSSE